MKKTFILVLLLMTVFLLTSCGNTAHENTEIPADGEPTIAATSLPTAEPTPTPEPPTLEEFLAMFGLTEEDIMPENVKSIDEVKVERGVAGEPNSQSYVRIYTERGTITSEDYDAWFDKIWAKLITLSKDGKLYKSYELGEEATPLSELREDPTWESHPGFIPCIYLYDLPYGEMLVGFEAQCNIQGNFYSFSISVSALH